jgi:DNA ligase (NAD+)
MELSANHLKTNKKSKNRKTNQKLKIVEKCPNLKINSEMEVKMKSYNEDFIDVLGELADLMQGQGEVFRAKAYQKAQEVIMTYDGDITSADQLKGVKGIGETIFTKLNEYIETGKISALEKQRQNPINVLTKVYGVGPKKAAELISGGITTVEALRENKNVLNDIQKVGLQYYDDINERIPRSEIDEYKCEFENSFKDISIEGSHFEIVGSYRREKQMSGDIDVIIKNDKNNRIIFEKFVDDLLKKGIIVEILSRGKTKCLVISRLSGKKARRVDFLYTSPEEYPFAVLYFTGSKAFNTVMRQRALDKGYTLNEHGMSFMIKSEKGEKGVKGEKVSQEFYTENDIFEFLDMEYKYPKDRIDGRSVQDKKSVVEVSQVTEEPQVQEIIKIVEKKPKKNITIKQRKIPTLQFIDNFKKEGLSALKILTENELVSIIKVANEAYYVKGDPIMTDNQYDILREHILERYPNNKEAKEGHASLEIKAEKNKETLPYEMWSMDKIKPDTDALKKWIEKYKDAYTISCKLDGVSGLYTTEFDQPKLYTRGNGIIGQDVSHLIPYIKVPEGSGFTVRGEFIISKEKFLTKYAKDFANSRNFVAGLVNKKTIDPNVVRDIDFVTYEVITPELKPSEQMSFLEKNGAQVVKYMNVSKITNEFLSELLINWRTEYKYEIDGVICIHDDVHPRVSGNPEHAFAFKMVLSDQVAEAKVVDVIWTPSKDGFLKPRVQIEPVTLSGVSITYATGFNAKFIEENKIGIGAIVQLVRSGDVIPHILSVPVPADQPLMPNVPYDWNDSHVDAMLIDKSDNQVVREKLIEGFFNKIGVDGFKAGKIKKVFTSGYDTIPKILQMTTENFTSIYGFGEKSANQISLNVKEKLEEANLLTLMAATNFARGIGEKKFQPILEKYPDILTSKEDNSVKIEKIETIKGISTITATKFVEAIPDFIKFIEDAGLQYKLSTNIEKKQVEKDHALFGKKIVMTGFRDKELADKIEAVGGELSGSVSKNTFIVLAKDPDETTGKLDKARSLGIKIMSPSDFKNEYFK